MKKSIISLSLVLALITPVFFGALPSKAADLATCTETQAEIEESIDNLQDLITNLEILVSACQISLKDVTTRMKEIDEKRILGTITQEDQREYSALDEVARHLRTSISRLSTILGMHRERLEYLSKEKSECDKKLMDAINQFEDLIQTGSIDMPTTTDDQYASVTHEEVTTTTTEPYVDPYYDSSYADVTHDETTTDPYTDPYYDSSYADVTHDETTTDAYADPYYDSSYADVTHDETTTDAYADPYYDSSYADAWI